MKKIGVILLIIAMIPLLNSCWSSTKEVVKGTGEGTTNIVEGAGRGVTSLGIGTADAAQETAEATGELLTGRGGEAMESGEAAINAGGEGIKNIVVEPIEGLGKGLQAIDAGIKRAVGMDDEIK